MDLERDGLLAGPALAEDQHARLGVRRDAADVFAKLLHRRAFSDELAVSVAAVVLDEPDELRVPRRLRDAAREALDRARIGHDVAVAAVGEHGGGEKFVVCDDGLRRLRVLLHEREEARDVRSERHSDRLHERSVERTSLALDGLYERGDLLLLRLAHRECADPDDPRPSPESLERACETGLVSGEAESDKDDALPFRRFVLHELGEPPLAHAHRLGVPVERAQRGRGGHRVFLPSPARQYQSIHGQYFTISDRICPSAVFVVERTAHRAESGRLPGDALALEHALQGRRNIAVVQLWP